MKFLRNLLATIVGLFIFSFIMFVFVVLFFAAASSGEEVVVKENSVLHISLNKPIAERSYKDPFDELFSDYSSKIGLIELLESINEAKEDDKIEGIYLESGLPIAGYASIEAIRDALNDFKSTGKFVTAYSEIYTEGGYYLASVADDIYLNPRGYIEFNGISANTTFLKGTFEKLEIEPEIFRVGDFKSAVEPFLRDDMSEESRLQMSSILESIHTHNLEKVADSRSLNSEELRRVSDSMLIQNPQDAINYNLITGVKYFDEVLSELKDKLTLGKEDKINFIGFEKYHKTIKRNFSSKNKIAVIVASGDIISGNGDNNTIGSTKFAKEIRKARTDDKVKAIVVRVNSPGGSALASDVIWREITLAKKEKPVIASMSDYAASGGYYIAMACDTIVAQPSTITGSIGIFMIMFNMQDFFKNKLGVTYDVVNTGDFSDIYTFTRPLTETEEKILQKNVNDGYEDFVSKAAEGRQMTVEALKKVASGRVWSGIQAKENGLVDELGNLEDAIAIAARASGIEDDYKVKYYPPQKGFFQELMEGFNSDLESKYLKKELGDLYPFIDQIKSLKRMQGPQARMLYDIKFE